MTKPVAVFRSGVIGDSRYTVRLDENSHLVLFLSFSRYITSWAISATWPAEASRSRCYRPGSGISCRVYGWLSVGYHVSGVSRPGRVDHSDPQRPSTGSIWRPISRTTGGVGFCPLDRAVGVNPRSFLRYGTRLVVLVPQHQTAMYETSN
jgi:hypothetical protein